jgi:putative SOS response-associated peptidase YedK
LCGRFTLTDPNVGLAVQFGLPQIPDMAPRYNIAPTQPVAAVRVPGPGQAREMVMLHWGLVPFWAKDLKIGAQLINARSETAAEKPSFRAAFLQRRCLVIADGFYEWQKQNGAKQPYFIRLRHARPFAFAGLWERWEGPGAGPIESCTLLTTEPNDLIRPLHSRMPAILHPDDYSLWLDPEVRQASLVLPLLRPYPALEMEAYPVSRLVNSPNNDTPQCIEPLVEGEDPRLPGL